MARYKLDDIWYDEDSGELYRQTKDGLVSIPENITVGNAYVNGTTAATAKAIVVSATEPTAGSYHAGDLWIQP